MTTVDWGALSTFSAGALAVIAAIIVGKKQASILEKQNATLQQQIETDARIRETDLKLKLIDRRTTLIDELRTIQGNFLREADLDDEHRRRLWRLIQEAQVVFPKETSDLLSALVELQFKARMANRKAQRLIRDGQQEEGDQQLELAMQLEQSIFTKFPEAIEALIEHTAVRL